MTGNGVAYIDNLPSELLALIFKFIHDDIKSSRSEKRFEAGLSRSPAVKDFDLSEDEGAEDDDDSDLDSDLDLDVNKFLASQQGIVFSASFPSEFPHSVAGVCPEWEAILSLSPAYWTRVVLPISHATSLEKTRQYLAWSRDLPIDIFILREWENKDYDKVTERELVRSFISFLRPYMRRCRSLHLEVKFNSCLPPLYKIVPNHAPLLKALDIHCAVDDPEAVLLDLTEEENGEEEEDEYKEEEEDDEEYNEMDYYPDLYFMKLDGRTWYNATMKRVPAWLIPQPQMRHMEISTFGGPFSRLPLVDTVQRLGMMSRTPLSSLCLSGLNLYYDPIEANRRPSRSFDGLISLYLGELDPDAIEHLLDMCVFDNLMTLTLRDCAGVRPRIFDQLSSIVGMLVLDKFAMTKNNSNPRAKVSHPHADMIRLLSNWHGIILSISASDASFDTVISALSKPTPVQQSLFPGESNLLCPNMQNLIVAACPSLTFDIFKKMIEKRNRKVNYRDPLWRQKDQEAPAITKLEIKFSWPKWTRQQMDWMKTRVADFQWLEY